MTDPGLSKWQTWMRAYSQRLEASFAGSEPFRHNVTKGESREGQVIDMLQALLPQRITSERNVVVVDQHGNESPKFDGVLIDRFNLPLLYQEAGSGATTSAAMIESIAAAIETKSSLELADLNDIFEKSSKLGHLAHLGTGIWPRGPLVTGFSYQCPNPNLSFFDYATKFWRNKEGAPGPICLLNHGILLALNQMHNELVVGDIAGPSSVPGFLRAHSDALLLNVYFLSRWVAAQLEETWRAYSHELFNAQTAFSFEPVFLDRITSSAAACENARGSFLNRPEDEITDLYEKAKRSIGL